MGILALDRRIDAEVLDARGALTVITGGQHLRATLREVPQLFVAGAQLSIALNVGGDRFEAVCRVLDDAVVVTPGSKLTLEVLKALPADVSGIEPFDLVPKTPPHGVPPPIGAATLDDEAPEDDEPTGVVGTLKEMPVSEIVQTLNQGAKDALVEVRPKGMGTGTIGIERGRVTFAHSTSKDGVELFGEPAFFALVQAQRGAFRIRYGRHPDTRNIQRDTVFLLLEGARILDEQMSGKQFMPSNEGPSFIDAVPFFAPDPQLASHTAFSPDPFSGEGVSAADPLDPVAASSSPRILDDAPASDVAPVTARLHATPPPLPTRPPPLPTKPSHAHAHVQAQAPAQTHVATETEPPVLEAFEAGVTLVDHEVPDGVRGPARMDSSGPFSRFFDEAGVHTPPPLPQETLRFQSLKLPAVLEQEDLDAIDSDRTTRERRHINSEPPH